MEQREEIPTEDTSEHQLNTSSHPFNNSKNQTIVEKDCSAHNLKTNSCDGSDSGVEILEMQDTTQTAVNLNPNQVERKSVTPTPSVDSSILSGCSNYDDAYNLLVGRNSTLIEGYKVHGTSENGSESSSVKSTKVSASEKTKRRLLESKKKHEIQREPFKFGTNSPRISNIKPPQQLSRCKSTDRNQRNTNCGNLNQSTRATVRSLTSTSSSTPRAPSLPRPVNTQQTDDGRWPSKNSKPAPLMTRSLRAISSLDAANVTPPIQKTVRVTNLQLDTKNTLEKYATLPRRRKIQELRSSTENLTVKNSSDSQTVTRSASLRRQVSHDQPHSLRSLPPFAKKRVSKTRIFHEISVQTMLTQRDIAKVLDLNQKRTVCSPPKCCIIQKETVDVQTDCSNNEEVDKLMGLLKDMTDKFGKLKKDYDLQKTELENVELLLSSERLEKDGLKHELKSNSERVFAILGCDNLNTEEDSQQDSLIVLENKLLNEKQLLLKQEAEISDLNVYCRTLQKNLNKSLAAQEDLLQHSHEQKIETEELHDFLQAEKNMLSDSLKDLETENSRLKKQCANFETEFKAKELEHKNLIKAMELKRQDNLGMQARLIALEAKSRELLVHQGSAVSGAAVALTSLVTRLEGLVEELIESYNISEQELDDVIFHNEAYSNSNCSSLDTTPDSVNKKFANTPSPKPVKTNTTPSSFVSAVINAIKNATTLASTLATNQQHFDTSRDELSTTDNSDNSAEMLDSETEPCLMMEHVLEDVILPDTHSHNMISSCSALNRSLFNPNSSLPLLTHSESLQILSTNSKNAQFNTSLLDQVIYVDNMVTRLLKVIRIIQMESETYTNELVDERDSFADQANSRKETNKIVVKQLGDWEVLGAQLKKEVELLMGKLSKKNDVMDGLKGDISEQRTEIEKLNKDICGLSTALSKAENDSKTVDEDVSNIIIQYKSSQDDKIPSEEIISRLINSLEEIPSLKSKLLLKDKQLKDLAKEYSVNRQVLAENLKGAVTEARKQYDAIDNALETLHGIQSVVHQCPPLAKLQRDLEEVNFQSASDLPLVVVPGDYNANAAALNQPLAVANHEPIATAINTSA